MGAMHLVLGGTKSGKTSYAQNKGRLCSANGGAVAYIATAQAKDAEMELRIKRHKADRPSEWITFEEPLKPDQCIEKNGNDFDVIILDCLTLWLSNCLMPFFAKEELSCEKRIQAENECCENICRLIEASQQVKADVYIISNYVESGLIPVYPMGRLFQDISGRAHQQLAASSKTVNLMVAGIPISLDPRKSVYQS